ncbi:hypothetical protein C2G38_2200159 [Gigaspora rosea]|uniref:Uncharacterized protein n=1 Tax=Gigaspora rosea TaxID=44941 RepID=A0A397UTW4_9GLOM|nr:hypothetical protein C2G38_2200159 [Gigaspora rosea]
MKEESNYPQSPLIKLFDKNRTFYYEIIKEGTYPLSNQCYYTKNPKYRIPNNYVIKTRHGKAKHLVECTIQYINKKPLFTIRFGADLKIQIQSSKSASNVACQYLKKLNETKVLTNMKKCNKNKSKKIYKNKSRISGSILFGLTLTSVENIHKTLSLDYNHQVHPFEELIRLEIGEEQFDISFGKFDEKSEKERKEAIPTTFEPITDTSEITDINIITNMLESIGMEEQHRITDILNYIIPFYVNKGILIPNKSTLHIRISGDGRNVERKVKHVMVTMAFSDWKFLATCLGMKAANTKYFCSWCDCSKENINSTNKKITKSIETIKMNYSQIDGHLKEPIFYMIPICNWVCDELHILLRITDWLWELMLSDLSREQVDETIWQSKF